MNESARIFFIMAGVLLLLAGIVAAAGFLAIDTDGSGGTGGPKYTIECSGTVVVKTGFANDLQGVSCVRDGCGFFDSLGFMDLGTYEEGDVRLVVGGNVVSSEDWESTYGKDQSFTLRSACVPLTGDVTVNLYDEKNDLVVKKTAVFQ